MVEGHAPVAAVQRLLAERPAALGLAVPGMPPGTPGVEAEGQPARWFDVNAIAFAADGSRAVFMAVRPWPATVRDGNSGLEIGILRSTASGAPAQSRSLQPEAAEASSRS
ncbi:DUF411 domain-containing protein [Benzoatithermus flavus]|uniref:DUF411 domain-containing protein n=1 Tax=Benzoatithermus flavus TaxID=3108223 RepID=A0ABU8XQL0_9PROT